MTRERSFKDETRVSDLTAVVTGVASPRGIGRGVAYRLARARRPLGLLDKDARALGGLASELNALGSPAAAVAEADISDETSVDGAMSQLETTLPSVGTLVNCAGIANPTPVLALNREEFERTLAVNTVGLFNLTHRLLPGMLAQGLGRLVSISSTAGQDGGGNYSKAAYAASKAGAEGFMRGLAREVAGSGVTANVISPANIDTDIMGGSLVGDRRAEFVGRTPVGRLGQVEELAELVMFLVGPHGGFTTGATYNLNGGLRIG